VYVVHTKDLLPGRVDVSEGIGQVLISDIALTQAGRVGLIRPAAQLPNHGVRKPATGQRRDLDTSRPRDHSQPKTRPQQLTEGRG
jgi:hypothetical protein